MTWLEIAANTMATASILLAGRNSIHTWWTGMIGCMLFARLFWGTQLYADAVLQGFFIAASAVGWWQWSSRDGHPAPPIRRTASVTLLWLALAGVVATIGYGTMLHVFTDAYAPFADSAVLAISVVAQLLLMARRVESWPAWLLVNTIAVPLYATRGLTLTAVLYTVYWVNALIAWRYWSRQLRPAGAAV